MEELDHFNIPITHDDCTTMKLRLVHWRKAYNKRQDEERWETEDELQEVLITPEQIMKFEESQLARDAVKTIGKVSQEEYLPSCDEFLLVRDYILTFIALANAHRSDCFYYYFIYYYLLLLLSFYCIFSIS